MSIFAIIMLTSGVRVDVAYVDLKFRKFNEFGSSYIVICLYLIIDRKRPFMN